MTPDELNVQIKISYIIDIEREINLAIRETVPEQIIVAALGNILIRRCQNGRVKEELFFKLMKEAWKHLEQ